ncbi:MAG: dTMP kinase [Candidatus Promineifilaceae bacterium]
MFITFEGPEGGGKTTQISLLASFLQDRGHRVLSTREPGGTRIGDQIRACLHDVNNKEMVAQTELLLYSASRAQLVHEVIRPALAAGILVLCDRFYDSTLAYQGYGRGLDLAHLRQITGFATSGLKPDLTLLFDIDVESGLTRRTAGGEEMNRLDLEALAFHQRVRHGFHALAAAEPARWVVIDAGRDPQLVQADVRRLVMSRLTP